jgi:transcription elongation factor Elf1
MGRDIHRRENRVMQLKDIVFKEVYKDNFNCYYCNLQKCKETSYIGLIDQYISHPLMCGNCKNKMEKK